MALVGNMTYHRRASSPGMALLGNMAYQMRPSLCGMALFRKHDLPQKCGFATCALSRTLS